MAFHSPVVLDHSLVLGEEHAGVHHSHGVGASETEPRLSFGLIIGEGPFDAPVLVGEVDEGGGLGRRHHEGQQDHNRAARHLRGRDDLDNL